MDEAKIINRDFLLKPAEQRRYSFFATCLFILIGITIASFGYFLFGIFSNQDNDISETIEIETPAEVQLLEYKNKTVPEIAFNYDPELWEIIEFDTNPFDGEVIQHVFMAHKESDIQLMIKHQVFGVFGLSGYSCGKHFGAEKVNDDLYRINFEDKTSYFREEGLIIEQAELEEHLDNVFGGNSIRNFSYERGEINYCGNGDLFFLETIYNRGDHSAFKDNPEGKLIAIANVYVLNSDKEFIKDADQIVVQIRENIPRY